MYMQDYKSRSIRVNSGNVGFYAAFVLHVCISARNKRVVLPPPLEISTPSHLSRITRGSSLYFRNFRALTIKTQLPVRPVRDRSFFFFHPFPPAQRNNGSAATLRNKWRIIMRRLGGIEVSRVRPHGRPTLERPRTFAIFPAKFHYVHTYRPDRSTWLITTNIH